MKKHYAKITARLTAIFVVAGTVSAFPIPKINHIPLTANAEEDDYDYDDEFDFDDNIIAGGKCGDDATWSINRGGELCIKGTGAMYDYYEPELIPWLDYCYDIGGIFIDEGITSVGAYAFRELEEAEVLGFSQTLKSVGESAFSGCSNLEKIFINSDYQLETIGKGAFENCDKITSFSFPPSLKNIDEYAFQGCTGLTSVYFGTGLESVKDTAFENCSSLANIYALGLPEKLNWETTENSFMSDKATVCHVPEPFFEAYQSKFAYLNVTFAEDINIKGSCGENAKWEVFDTDNNGTFDKIVISGSGYMTDYEENDDDTVSPTRQWNIFMNNIVAIEIGKDILSVGNFSFNSYRHPISLSIEEDSKLVSIGESAFEKNTFLSPVIIPETVTEINDKAFCYSYGIKSIVIPQNVTYIGHAAFGNIYDLESIAFEEGSKLESIGMFAFNGAIGNETLTLPKSVKHIGNFAFGYIRNLKTFTIEEESMLEDLGEMAFINCNKLESISIPEGITAISNGLFYNCYNLKDFDIPNSVTSIGENAFGYCKSLNSLTIPAGVTSIGSNAFYGVPLADIYLFADPTALEWTDEDFDDFIYDIENTPDEHCITKCHVPAEYLEAYKTKFSTGNEKTDINVSFVSDGDSQTTSSSSTTTASSTTTSITTAASSTSSNIASTESTNLPQTGMPNVHKTAAGLAVIMGIMGTGLIVKSRKE